MSFQSFIKWLLSQAGAGWLVGIVSLIGLLVIFAKKKAQRLVYKEIRTTSLVRIKETVREKIAVSFNNEPVENLAQIETEIYNEGTRVIKDILLTFKYPKGTKVLDVPSEVTPDDMKVEKVIEGRQVQVKIPYLNPLRQHKHKVRLATVVDGKVENIKVTGGGEGWSIRRIMLPSARRLTFRLGVISVLWFAFLVLSFPYSRIIVQGVFGIDPMEISVRAFLAFLPFIFAIFAVFVWGVRSIFLKMPRKKD